MNKIETIKEIYSALNRNDVSGFLQYFDPEIKRVEFEGTPSGGSYHGLEEMREHVSKGRGTWTEGGCEPQKFISEGNKVITVVHVRVLLKEKQEWIEGQVTDVFVFKDDKVIEMRSFAEYDLAMKWIKEDQ